MTATRALHGHGLCGDKKKVVENSLNEEVPLATWFHTAWAKVPSSLFYSCEMWMFLTCSVGIG
jgi:hypothetical protein